MPTIPTGLIPTGLIRKALIISTAGLAARVWKDNSEKQSPITLGEKPARPRRQTKAKAKRTAAKATAKASPRRAARKAAPRRRTKAVRRPQPQAGKRQTAKAGRQMAKAGGQMAKAGAQMPRAARRSKPKTARRRAAKPAPTSTIARTAMPMTARTATPTIAPTGGAGNGTAAALERITILRDQGALSYEEFAAAKTRILDTGRAAGEAGDQRRSFESVEASVAAAGDLAGMSRTPRG
jgi:hypothetical protein